MKKIREFAVTIFLGVTVPGLSPACSVDIAYTHFGIYQPFDSAPLDTTGVIAITCPVATNYIIRLDAGSSPTGYYPRKLVSTGASSLDYNLYIDISRSRIWGDGLDGTYAQAGFGTGNLAIYGRIPGSQNVKDGVYIDTIGVLVEY